MFDLKKIKKGSDRVNEMQEELARVGGLMAKWARKRDRNSEIRVTLDGGICLAVIFDLKKKDHPGEFASVIVDGKRVEGLDRAPLHLTVMLHKHINQVLKAACHQLPDLRKDLELLQKLGNPNGRA